MLVVDYEGFTEDIATVELPQEQAVRGEVWSFARSKYLLATQVYQVYHTDFYGGCDFRLQQKLLVPVLSSCGYVPRKDANRAKRIEWEHIVPAWVFGHQLQCWQQGRRKQCSATNAAFRQMEADMHNLVPAIGELNGDRSNFRYQMISGEPRAYGSKVNIEIDFQQRTAEPPDNVWGDAARASLYMHDRYGIALGDAQEKLFRAWNNLDPVDVWEQQRNRLITQLQGNDNPYVTNYRKLDVNVTNEGSVNGAAAQLDWVDQLYLLVFQHRDKLPYAVVSLATIVYLGYLQAKRRRRPRVKAKRK
ncbi:endonuclease [Thiothrix lacustris]|uniref:endonuclease n=1 Tax=Thiothrix lacustris TaxID=525917 RepID=UPI0027E4A23F|nr:endonuclease [Thiothrix lacustris]WMP16110.1 endonuclease [Thiothrix lacustris]